MPYNNLLEFIYDSNNKVKSTLCGVHSIIENARNLKTKLASFISANASRTVDDEVLLVPLTDLSDNKLKLLEITKSQLQSCINGDVDTITLTSNNYGGAVTVSADEVVSSIQDEIQECSLQSEFLEYAINSTNEIKSSDFISIIRGKYQSISGAMMEKYTNLMTSDPIETLSSFFGLANVNVFNKVNEGQQSEYTEIVDISSYNDGPNVWLTGVGQIFNTIGDIFQKAMQNITGIADFFNKLWKAVQDLIHYLTSKLFANLNTIYSKGGRKFGIMDFPLVQFKLGTLYEYNDNQEVRFINSSLTYISTILSHLPGVSQKDPDQDFLAHYIASNYKCVSDDILGSKYYQLHHQYIGFKVDLALQMIANNLRHQNEDGSWYYMPYDVMLPLSSDKRLLYDIYPIDDLLMRITITDEKDVYLALYQVTSYDVWAGYSDYKNYLRMMEALSHSFIYLCEHFALLPYNQHTSADPFYSTITNSADFSQDALRMVQKYIASEPSVPQSEDNYNPINNFKILNNNLSLILSDLSSKTTTYWSTGDNWLDGDHFCLWLAGLLCNAAVNGPISSVDTLYQIPGSPNHHDFPVIESINHIYGYQLHSLPGGYADPSYERNLYNAGFSFDGYDSMFRPYVKYQLTPVSVHFQTYQERVDEVKRVMISVVVITAASIITYKLLKFRKNQIIKAELAQAQLDSYSWDMFDPEKQTSIEEYKKLRKKSKHINRFNSLLGFSSPSDVAESTNSLLGGVTGSLLGLSGNDSDKYTVADLFKIIHG